MVKASHAPGSGASSRARQYPTRQAVLVAQTEACIHETSTERIDIAVAIARGYHERVAAGDRTIPIDPEPAGSDSQDYYRWAERTRKQVERWMDGSVRIPVEIEEAWVAALPQPYQWRVIHVLSARFGVLPVSMPEAASMDPGGSGDAMKESGEAIQAEAPIWSDGAVHAGDYESVCRAEREYREAASAMLARAEQWRAARERLEEGGSVGTGPVSVIPGGKSDQ